MEITKLKTYIQSTNINFLFGSGLSQPYLSTLGDIEKWLTELAKDTVISDDVRQIIKSSIYKEYFTKVILSNYSSDKENENYKIVINNYKNFLTIWNEIINKRANCLLSKQVNIYTTNIDTLVENATENAQVEFNDGFKGSIKQIFDESNFQKSYSKTSLHFQNVSEIPVFNYLKMHGSINWANSDNNITNDCTLNLVNEINIELQKIDVSLFIETICPDCKQSKLYEQLSKEALNNVNDKPNTDFNKSFQSFFELYEKLVIVNPTKQKFIESVTELHFYELMRMYSNSLEKENSVLFVMGFSFADEHIAKITLRAANTNPTLLVVIFSFNNEKIIKDENEFDNPDFENYNKLKNNAINNNIVILTPSIFKESNKADDKEIKKKEIIDNITNFDLTTINSVFQLIDNEIPVNYGR
jgi:hypothetical protein